MGETCLWSQGEMVCWVPTKEAVVEKKWWMTRSGGCRGKGLARGSWLVGKKQRSRKSSVMEETPPSTSKMVRDEVLNVHGEETYEDAVKLGRGIEEPPECAVE